MIYIATEKYTSSTNIHYFYNNTDNMLYEYWSNILFRTCVISDNDFVMTRMNKKAPIISVIKYMHSRNDISQSDYLRNHILSIILTEL